MPAEVPGLGANQIRSPHYSQIHHFTIHQQNQALTPPRISLAISPRFGHIPRASPARLVLPGG
jgi:hypothetical protein